MMEILLLIAAIIIVPRVIGWIDCEFAARRFGRRK